MSRATQGVAPHLRGWARAAFVSARTVRAAAAVPDCGGANGDASTIQYDAPCWWKPMSVSLGSLSALHYFSAMTFATAAADA